MTVVEDRTGRAKCRQATGFFSCYVYCCAVIIAPTGWCCKCFSERMFFRRGSLPPCAPDAIQPPSQVPPHGCNRLPLHGDKETLESDGRVLDRESIANSMTALSSSRVPQSDTGRINKQMRRRSGWLVSLPADLPPRSTLCLGKSKHAHDDF